MKIKKILSDVIVTFTVTFIAAIIVTLLWNALVEKEGAVVDWKTSFRFALIFGLVFPIMNSRNKNK